MLLSALLVGIVVTLIPENSYAWGPGVHIKLGLEMIDKIYEIAPAIADIIKNNPYHYLYGAISPDIIIGKKFAKDEEHCHNWEVGKTIMRLSETDAEKAFAYGYMSHLAADSVSHNYFVPNQIISTFTSRILKHAYWEMRYDGLLECEVWDVFKEIPKEVRHESNKRLKEILTTTLFSFSTNKHIFNGIMHVNRISKWRDMIKSVSDNSQWVLSKKDVDNFYRLTFNSQSDLLCNNNNALCLRADPNGKDSLMVAKNVRKELHALYKKGSLSDYDCKRIVNELKPRFIKKLTSSEKIKHTIVIKNKDQK